MPKLLYKYVEIRSSTLFIITMSWDVIERLIWTFFVFQATYMGNALFSPSARTVIDYVTLSLNLASLIYYFLKKHFYTRPHQVYFTIRLMQIGISMLSFTIFMALNALLYGRLILKDNYFSVSKKIAILIFFLIFMTFYIAFYLLKIYYFSFLFKEVQEKLEDKPETLLDTRMRVDNEGQLFRSPDNVIRGF